MSSTVPVNTAVAVQAAWQGGSDPMHEQAQSGAKGVVNKAISSITRMFLLDTDRRGDGVTWHSLLVRLTPDDASERN